MEKKKTLLPFAFLYKGPFSLIRYFILGIFYTITFLTDFLLECVLGVFKLIKGIFYGWLHICHLVYFIFKNIMKVFVFICFIVYKIVKYFCFGLIYPAVILNISFKKARLNRVLRLEDQSKKGKKAEEKSIKEAEKIALKQKKKGKDIYINEKAKIKKTPFSERVNNFFESLITFPKRTVNNIKEWYNNLTLVKNANNQKNIKMQAMLINFDGEDAKKSDVKVVYEYVAKNPEGKVVKDYFEAFSKVEVHSFLLSEGYEVYKIRTSKMIQLFHGNIGTNNTKIKIKDLIFFLTQLSTYIKAGIPLVDALKILEKQYKNKSYQRIFNTMVYDLTTGDNFSVALEKQGKAFPRLLINMVKASELTGELPEALDNMAEYYTETNKTRQQMITALTYPTIVLVIALAVITFIMMYIVPKFVDIYASMDNSAIPGITIFVLNISHFLEKNILWLFFGFILFVLLFVWLYHNVKVFRMIVQLGIMKLPVFGDIIIYNEVTMFTKTLSTLLSHNVFITDSMEILNKITNNEVYKMIILDTINNIAKGEKISLAFNHWAFPIPAYEMIVTGEKTGQLPQMMDKVSAYYQELHRNSVSRIKTLLEPTLIVFLTVVVGIIVLSIVIPMFNIYGTIQGMD